MKFPIQIHDKNANGILDGAELTHWREAAKIWRENVKLRTEWIESIGYPTDEVRAGFWTDSQIDDDENTGSQAEIAESHLREQIWFVIKISASLRI